LCRLMAMLRQRILTGSAEFRLVDSVRGPGDYVLRRRLRRRGHTGRDVRVGLHMVNQVVATDAESVVTIGGDIPNMV
jgi:hypothetical protein